MNYEDIKRHFESSPPPKEVRWTPWANITDTQVFLKSCHTTIRNYNGPMERCPAWWHLRDFYILMKKNSQQTAALQADASEENTQGDTAEEQTPSQTISDPLPEAEISEAQGEIPV